MLFFPGVPCAICGKAINDSIELIAFAHFTPNMKDPLWILSDAGIHKECLNNFLYKKELEEYWELDNNLRKKKGFKCDVCGEQITNLDDFFGLGYLTLDKNDPLYKYNFFQLHRNCIPKVKELKKLLELLKNFYANGGWDKYAIKYWGKLFDLFEKSIT